MLHPVPTRQIYSYKAELFLYFQNFATADRPRCMNRDENFLRHTRQLRNRDYASDEYEQTNWHWNMSHQPNGNALINAKSQQKSKNAVYGSQRSQSSSGFHSFFRWFKKDEKSRGVSDISYPREVTRISSTDTLDFDNDRRVPRRVRRKLKAFDSCDTISPPSSPRLSRAFNQSSSCDSVFSTASSFAFVPPVKYLSSRNQKQVNIKARLEVFPIIWLFFVNFSLNLQDLIVRKIKLINGESKQEIKLVSWTNAMSWLWDKNINFTRNCRTLKRVAISRNLINSVLIIAVTRKRVCQQLGKVTCRTVQSFMISVW